MAGSKGCSGTGCHGISGFQKWSIKSNANEFYATYIGTWSSPRSLTELDGNYLIRPCNPNDNADCDLEESRMFAPASGDK